MSTESGQTRQGHREGPAARKARGTPQRERELRNTEAVVRDEARAARSPQEQLALLDERLGKGIGAKRERERLLAQIANRRNSAESTSVVRRPKRAATVADRDAKRQTAHERLDANIIAAQAHTRNMESVHAVMDTIEPVTD